jgi:hypothetical protein
MAVPTHIFGFPARPLRPIEEVIVARAKVGAVDIAVLRWERRDFAVDGLKPSDGWFVSYSVSDASGVQDLLQFRTPFFAPMPIAGLRGVGAEVAQGDGVSAPRWHKSDRAWPSVGEEEAHFVGQFYYDEVVAYLFVLLHEAKRLYVVFKDEVSRQDAEEHYRDEAQKG